MAHKRSRQAFEDDLKKQTSPFVIYGTALPPLDDDARDDGSYVPVWKQEVTDERGRKRLHGAFTGGFSAGYFNTVGSKEGWTPSTFVSSRSNRVKDQSMDKQQQQKPEDFMDEEDIREQEESRQLSTNDEFAGFGTQSDPSRQQNALMDLFRPAESSMGNKLLNKMGWKPGQGIGPRIKRRIDPDGDVSETRFFPPDDVPMISFSNKNDTKGLGYEMAAEGLVAASSTTSSQQRQKVAEDSDDEENAARPGLSFMTSKKKSMTKTKKGGFGVGILNDTGSDDEDPYSMGPKISYTKTIGPEKKTKKKANASFGAANPLLRNTPTFVSKKLSTMQNALRKCHDGRLPLAGFVLADELDSFSSMSLTDEKYKPLEVPTDWKPANLPDSQIEDSGLVSDQAVSYQSTADAAKVSSHTSATRGTILGEQKLPGKSVFDYLTPAAREKLMKATGRMDLPPALSEHLAGTEAGATEASAEIRINVPYLDAATATSALSRAESGGFIPYAEDLDKRARYKWFLQIAAGQQPDGTQPLKPSQDTRDEDWTNELNEFVRAAEVFRPMTGAIASRFTSSSSQSQSSSSNLNARTAGEEGDTAENNNKDLIRKPSSKPEDPAEVAAKLGMFGVMTRTISSFQPTKLVCKRFGVDMPVYTAHTQQDVFRPSPSFQSAGPAGAEMPTSSHQSTTAIPPTDDTTSQSTSKLSTQQSANLARSQDETSQNQQHEQAHLSRGVSSFKEDNSVTIDPNHNPALDQPRPGQDVFRAIFGDSDSSDDDDDDGNG